jgi:hypothetical protein
LGRENIETKTAILNYVAQDTFSTAQELQTALSKLRQMRLDILMKLINDHNSQSSSDEDLLKNALLAATANRQKETEDFFGSFENQLLANEDSVRRVAGRLSPRQKELAQQIAQILNEPSTTQEEKTKMLRALDSLNSFLESAINLLAFGKFRPTSFL